MANVSSESEPQASPANVASEPGPQASPANVFSAPEPQASQADVSSDAVPLPNPVEGLPKLVDLGAHACVPCKMMAPILEELTTEFKGRFDVLFIDVWQNPDEGKKYRINSIPTQIFFDGEGKELFRHEGFFSREDILKTWTRLGFVFAEEK
ncbi:MAG: thioredoxin family protein [Phycisphaerae bacterium]|nr:thioredoxin family protein [Phycisphaerae bacterium]